MKVQAFCEVAAECGLTPEAVHEFSQWQRKNFGVSRYTVLAELLEGRFGPVRQDAGIETCLEKYGERVRAAYSEVPEIPGLRILLRSLKHVSSFVASGSDEAELRSVMLERSLAQHFKCIYGSPKTKSQILSIIKDRGDTRRAIYLGDAAADLDAALEAGLDFVAISGYSMVAETIAKRASVLGFATFHDLLQFSEEVTIVGSGAS